MHTETSCKYLPYANVSGSSFLYTCCTDVIQLLLGLCASKYCSTYMSTVGGETACVNAAILYCVSYLSVSQYCIM